MDTYESFCDVPGCQGAQEHCHGGEMYLCSEHYDDLVGAINNQGLSPEDWWLEVSA